MRLGWKWVDREKKQKNSLSPLYLGLPTTLILSTSEEIASFIDWAVNYHLRAIVKQSY